MRPLLCIPDPKPIAAALIDQVKSFFKGARVDVSENHDVATEQLRSFLPFPDFFLILLLFGGRMTRESKEPWEPKDMLDAVRDECQKLFDLGFAGREIALEIGNEPDLGHKRFKENPEELGGLYKEAIGVVKSFSASWHCLSPSISNLDEDSLDYLRRMALPVGSEIAFHRYPPGKGFWSRHRGFADRAAEVRALKRLANGAPLWCTELGWAELNPRYTLTEEEVAERIKQEVRYFWREQNVEALCLYQMNSSAWKESDSGDHRRLSTYGARRPDGTWKPWATAVKEACA